jgi:hypothetical protein
MKKIIAIMLLVGTSFFSSNAFSQNENRIGLKFEMGTFAEYAKGGDGMGGRQFFVTPTYSINDRTRIGAGAGLKLFKQYKEESFISAFPLYVSALYKFKTDGITPFAEAKAGYTFLNNLRSGKIDYLSYFPWASYYIADSEAEKEYRTETRGGLFFSPSFGFLFPLKNRQYFSASVAYGFDRTSVKTEISPTAEKRKGSFNHHSLALRIGYIF